MSASAAAPAAASSTAAGVCWASSVLRTIPRTSSLLRTEPLPTACMAGTCRLNSTAEAATLMGTQHGIIYREWDAFANSSGGICRTTPPSSAGHSRHSGIHDLRSHNSKTAPRKRASSISCETGFRP